MHQDKAIPEGYMTVGEIAKKMGVTVRTLQYYDQKGLLTPSAESEGGRRLYSDKDMVLLHQILSLKSLGFSLGDIKKRLIPLDDVADIEKVLAEQADDLRRKIKTLTKSLADIEKLKAEVLSMQSVDFKKYADIIVNLQMDNDYYYLIKYMEDDTLEDLRTRFDKESGADFMRRLNTIGDRFLDLKAQDVPVHDPAAQKVAAEFWGLVMEFTDGDMTRLPEVLALGEVGDSDLPAQKRQEEINEYMQPALGVYLQKLGINPFEGVDHD